MKRTTLFTITAAAACIGAPLVLARAVIQDKAAAQEKTVQSRSDDDISKLVEKLGSPNFEERDAALEKLRASGSSALPALDAAAGNSDDPEIRWNARRLAREIRDGGGVARVAPRRR